MSQDSNPVGRGHVTVKSSKTPTCPIGHFADIYGSYMLELVVIPLPNTHAAIVGDTDGQLVLGQDARTTLEVSNDFAVYLRLNSLAFEVALRNSGLQSSSQVAR